MRTVIAIVFVISISSFVQAQEKSIQFNAQLNYYQNHYSDQLKDVYSSPLLMELGFEFQQPIGRAFSINPILGFSQFKERFGNDDLRWPIQHDGNGGFDPTIPSGESFENTKHIISLNYGLLLKYHPSFLKGISFSSGLLLKSPIYSNSAFTLIDGQNSTTTNRRITQNKSVNSNIRIGAQYQRSINQSLNYLVGFNWTRSMSAYEKNDMDGPYTFWGAAIGINYVL